MVQAMVDIPDEVNHVLNIVKARYKLRTKSEAISKIVIECGLNVLEPELRPEYLEKLKKIRKEKGTPFRNVYELHKRIVDNAKVRDKTKP